LANPIVQRKTWRALSAGEDVEAAICDGALSAAFTAIDAESEIRLKLVRAFCISSIITSKAAMRGFIEIGVVLAETSKGVGATV
jgi:hypothetical protein